MRKFIAWVKRLIFRKRYNYINRTDITSLYPKQVLKGYKPTFKHHKNNYDVEIIKETSGRKHYWVSSQYGIHRINKNNLGD
jgi:hypothetical protein